MRILDRYILRSVLGVFLGCLLSFIFLYIIIDLFSHLDEILKNKAAVETLVRYYCANMPLIFVQVVPIASLLATLYTFAKLNRDNEIIAMRSCGLSIPRLTNTVIIFGVLMSILVFVVNDKLVPSALSYTEKIKEQMESGPQKEKEKEQQVIKNLSIYGVKNRLFFINTFFVATNTMEGITILEQDEKQNVTKKIVAQKGEYIDGVWKFYQCLTYTFDEEGQVLPEYQEEEFMPFTETPDDFLTQRQRPDSMNISQLDDYILKLSKSGATTVVRNLKVDLYQRFAFPFTTFIIIILGIPFAFMIRKRATGLSSLGISLIMGFLYYVLNAVSIALGKAGILPPFLAVSLSHILALVFSLYLIGAIP